MAPEQLRTEKEQVLGEDAFKMWTHKTEEKDGREWPIYTQCWVASMEDREMCDSLELWQKQVIV